MKFLQFGDLHLERGNLDQSVPPLEAIVKIAREHRPDIAIFTGDAVTRRGAFHPEAAYRFRVALEAIAEACPLGLIAIDGNHDVSFDGSKSFLVGALADETEEESSTGNITIVSGQPQILTRGGINWIAIPTFDRYAMKLATDQTDDTAEGIVAAAVRGLVAQADGLKVAVYHGSLAGARLGNEQIIRAGIDVPVDPAAFSGCAAVLLGHIHKPQELTGPGGFPLIYNGATCPLSWGEKAIEPSVVLGEVAAGGVTYQRIGLPVVSQMIEVQISGPEGEPTEVLAGACASAPAGARLRLKVAAPAEWLAAIPRGMEDHLAQASALRSVDIVKEPTTAAQVAGKMDRRISITDAVERWAAERPEISAADRAALLDLAAVVESEVRDEDLDAAYDFQPETLEISNWCQYADARLDFDGLRGVTMIRGANTAGKSNLVRAIPFALYKSQRAGDVMADLIRNGEDRADVVLVFRSHGQRWRIRRTLKRGKDRGASSVMYFERESGSSWDMAVEGTEQETQAKINEMVGPPDLFFAAAYADQNAIDSLLKLRPAEMKDLLASVLHRDFGSRVEKVRALRRVSEEARSQAQAIVGELERATTSAVEDRQTIATANALRAEIQTKIEALGIDDLLVRKVEMAVADAARLREAAKTTEQATSDLAAAHSRMVVLQTKIDDGRKAVHMAQTAAGEVKVLHKRQADLVEAKRARDAYQEARDQAAEAFLPIAQDGQAKAAALREYDAARVAKIEAAKKHKRQVDTDLERAKRTAGLLDSVPCGGGEVGGVDCSACPLIGEAVGQRSGLAALEAAAVAAGAALDALSGDDDVRLDLAHAASLAVDATGRASEALDAATSDLNIAVRRVADLEGEIAALGRSEARLAESEAVAKQVPGWEAELVEVQQVADRLSRVVSATTIGEEVAAAEMAVESARRELSEVQSLRRRLDGDLAALGRTVAQAEARVGEADKAAARKAELVASIAEREREIRVFALYEQALGRDGVPFLLIELYAVPQIAERVNHYLAPTEFRVRIETERRAVTAGVKPGVYVSFDDKRGLHPLSAASGFQSVAIGSGLRQAISDLHAAATGTRIRLSVQDEGFGAYDQENIKGASETIRRVAESRETFMFVSHVEGMDSVADQIVTVTPADTGSVVSVEAA